MKIFSFKSNYELKHTNLARAMKIQRWKKKKKKIQR